MANQSKSFGIFSGSGGGGASGVTSVTAGTGLTASPNPITATGTISLKNVNGLVSSFDGGSGPQVNLNSTAGSVPIYDPTTYPSTTFTMEQNGRAFFGISDAGANERLGIGGVSTFDLIKNVSIKVGTTCVTGGVFAAAVTGGGVLSGTYTGSPASITCDGTLQEQTFTRADFRVGSNTQAPNNPNTDFLQATWILAGTQGGAVRYTDFRIDIEQFSD